jgi:hypothetical protein
MYDVFRRRKRREVTYCEVVFKFYSSAVFDSDFGKSIARRQTPGNKNTTKEHNDKPRRCNITEDPLAYTAQSDTLALASTFVIDPSSFLVARHVGKEERSLQGNRRTAKAKAATKGGNEVGGKDSIDSSASAAVRVVRAVRYRPIHICRGSLDRDRRGHGERYLFTREI